MQYAQELVNIWNRSCSVKCDSVTQAKRFYTLSQDAIHCADDYLKFLCKWVVEQCSHDLAFVSKRIDSTCIDRLESMISSSLEKVTYTEAVKGLEKVKLNISLDILV